MGSCVLAGCERGKLSRWWWYENKKRCIYECRRSHIKKHTSLRSDYGRLGSNDDDVAKELDKCSRGSTYTKSLCFTFVDTKLTLLHPFSISHVAPFLFTFISRRAYIYHSEVALWLKHIRFLFCLNSFRILTVNSPQPSRYLSKVIALL